VGPVVERVLEFAAQRKNLIGVAVDEAPGVGERDRAARPLEEADLEGPLERPNLSADGGLREVQRAAGLRDAPLAGRHPEVEEMVIVQPVHGGTFRRV
jgi:hypothetical protein